MLYPSCTCVYACVYVCVCLYVGGDPWLDKRVGFYSIGRLHPDPPPPTVDQLTSHRPDSHLYASWRPWPAGRRGCPLPWLWLMLPLLRLLKGWGRLALGASSRRGAARRRSIGPVTAAAAGGAAGGRAGVGARWVSVPFGGAGSVLLVVLLRLVGVAALRVESVVCGS